MHIIITIGLLDLSYFNEPENCALLSETVVHNNWLIQSENYHTIGVARGCSGCTCNPPPRAEKKIVGPRRNLQGKFVSAPPAHQVHPHEEQESILGHFCWAVEIWRWDRVVVKKGARNWFTSSSYRKWHNTVDQWPAHLRA